MIDKKNKVSQSMTNGSSKVVSNPASS